MLINGCKDGCKIFAKHCRDKSFCLEVSKWWFVAVDTVKFYLHKLSLPFKIFLIVGHDRWCVNLSMHAFYKIYFWATSTQFDLLLRLRLHILDILFLNSAR